MIGSRGLPRVILLLLAGAAWLACALALAQPAGGDLVAIPPLQAHVTDLSGTLSAGQQAQLEQQLAAFETARGSQIAILLVPTVQPEAIEQFSIRVAEAWKIGRRNHDDGVLITVAKNDRKMRIDVGYGLEGAIPDAIAKRIISETMAPKFRQGDFAGGLSGAVAQMEKLIEGESLPPPAKADRGVTGSEGSFEQLFVIGLMLSVVAGGVLRAMFGRLAGSGLSSGLVGAAAWFITGSMLVAGIGALIAFVFVLVLSSGAGRRASHGGGWGGGGWTGGSGGSWGGGSDSWGGGGGGSFGGGGASGDW
ncbi:MAG: TPM domain-containing protein [Sterolibacteriaceae bacterium]|nr:TPM domain-containing protein [Sterolibacteriaceae bacterium]MBK9085190.1 TPM domain-containing protein [Sterolibacteriaceae bacterium]